MIRNRPNILRIGKIHEHRSGNVIDARCNRLVQN
jgi:hypothetical protein